MDLQMQTLWHYFKLTGVIAKRGYRVIWFSSRAIDTQHSFHSMHWKFNGFKQFLTIVYYIIKPINQP